MRCSLPVSIMSLLVVLLAAPGRVLANPPVDYLVIGGPGAPPLLRVYPGKLTVLHTLTPITESSLPEHDRSMLVSGPSRTNPLFVAQQGTLLVPRPQEELDAEGWIAVHALAFLGAIWLDNISAGQAGGTDAAILKGGGVRVMYGIGPLLALECEGIGASSGAAELIDISGDADAIERQAKFGRVQCQAGRQSPGGGVYQCGSRCLSGRGQRHKWRGLSRCARRLGLESESQAGRITQPQGSVVMAWARAASARRSHSARSRRAMSSDTPRSSTRSSMDGQ